MPCRRRSCAPGAVATGSMAARWSVPGSTGSRPTSASTCCAAGRGTSTHMRTFAEVPWLQPYPDQLARRGRADRGRAGLGRGRARDHRAGVPRRHAGAATSTTGRADRPGRARLAGERDGDAPRDERRGRQQRAAACPRDDERASAREALRVVRRLPERRGTRPARPVHRRARALRRGRRPSPSPPRTCASRCRRTRTCSRASMSSVRSSTARCARASGGCSATWANRMPTAASYLRKAGDTEFRAFKFDVLRVEDGKVAEITTFGPELFACSGCRTPFRADRPRGTSAAASSPCGTSAPSPRPRPRPRRWPPRGSCTGRAT